MTNPDYIPVDDLVTGRRYTLDIDDCCVAGELTATFVRLHHKPPNINPVAVEFDIGTLTNWSQVGFLEIP